MATANLAAALSHWQKPVDGFQTSALEFYSAVEAGLKERSIPGIKFSRVKFKETGVASPDRIYLRIKRKGLFFDIGAAPFGNGYFFSWWMSRSNPSPWLGALFLIGLILLIPWLAKWAVAIISSVLFKIGVGELARTMRYARPPILKQIWDFTWLDILAMGLLFVGVRKLLLRLSVDVDGLLSAVPILGRVYRWIFARETYYSVDTMLMYQSLVSAVVVDCVDKLTTAKGLRALSEDEKKPVMKDLLKKSETRVWTQSA